MANAFQNEIGKLLGAVRETYGHAAVYRPPTGDPVVCTVILDAPEQALNVRGFGAPMVALGATVEVERSVIAKPVCGGKFEIDDEVFEIIEEPLMADSERLIWTCTCSPR